MAEIRENENPMVRGLKNAARVYGIVPYFCYLLKHESTILHSLYGTIHKCEEMQVQIAPATHSTQSMDRLTKKLIGPFLCLNSIILCLITGLPS